jgi:hypothetical protein
MIPSHDDLGHEWTTLEGFAGGPEPVCALCGIRRSQVMPDVKCRDVLASQRVPTRIRHDYDPFDGR